MNSFAKLSIAIGSVVSPVAVAVVDGPDRSSPPPTPATVVVTTPATTADPGPTTTLHFRELSDGMNGPDVLAVQQRLKDLGYHLIVDGWYGPKTREVVKKFQKEHHLYMDGIVGPQTYAALGIVP